MPAPSYAAALSPGTVFANDYRVVRPLAEGGMGAVFVVQQLSTGRERALKIMHPDLLMVPALAKRFVQEARVGAGIESDHVVEVLAAGIDEGLGLPWLVMELLKGEDLGTVLKHRPVLSRGEVALIFQQLCHALGAAHAQGVVHRDLKPENIFLAASRTTGTAFTVKVLDFGIAKVVTEGRTRTTAALGSPLWMAPEQTEAGRPITPATDVWAAGLIAFRMLTGNFYWRGAVAESASPVMLLREVVFDPIVPASERAREMGCEQNLPAGFDAWFARCVARDPADRFPSAAQMYAAMVPVVGGAEAGEGVDGLARTMPLLPTPADMAMLPRTPRAIVRPEPEPAADLDDDPPQGSKPVAQGGSKGRTMIYASLAAGLLIAGIVWGARKVISEAESAAAKVVASAEQVHQQEKEQEQTEVLKKRLAVKRAEWDRVLGQMIAMPAGAFDMGADEDDNNEKPVHRVSVPAFDIDSTEVTVAGWQLCVSAGKCTAPATGAHCNWGQPERRMHPINCVDANQAQGFCDWAAKRLPTEEEWEYAARAPDGRAYPWGKIEPSTQACWRRGDDAGALAGTCAVGEAAGDESASRVRGLAGNVHEWTGSAYCPYARKNCGAVSRVIRGGSWRETEGAGLRAMTRMSKQPDFQADDVGLRCARNPL